MLNSPTPPASNRLVRGLRPFSRLALICFVGLGLAACSDESKETSSEDQNISGDQKVATASTSDTGVFDAALEKTPCDIVPKEMVAKLFGVPADQLEVTNAGSSKCGYQWGKNEEMLEVIVNVDVFDTAEAASSHFRGITRGMSAQEVAKAMQGVVAKVEEDGKLATDTMKGAAKQIAGAIGGKALQFEDVEGVADEARFGSRFGTLYVRQGNLQFGLSAYHGLSMTMPEEFTADAITEAAAVWKRETLDERKQQSTELARAIVAAL